ncbi:MAG: DEAD/DEAH box helicase [Gammaproteobacteria bacterium]|nr:DEAD/DEAH box helicase [Gammaproteobacteria bacterium]
MSSESKNLQFSELGLTSEIEKVIREIGYETPSPIQAESIPPLLAGRDIVGQAQTGTGKTAAFALPLLSKIKLSKKQPQILVLAPTRELAIQVAEAFQVYARYMKGFQVLPIYGGQSMGIQLKQLKRGAHVIVGTPGRVMDHLRRKTLNLSQLAALVLDEADEMLNMGFIEDVEWILGQAPEERQIALFSATMPSAIKKITRNYLNDPVEVKIKTKTATVDTITQRYWQVTGTNKLDALTRILEVDPFDAIIIFVRTKNATVELSEKLEARGYSSSAINGDMNQQLREKTIARLKSGSLDLLVATDVAARGLDVGRVSHVINYDVPYDTEAYVHRIGRTGRAGKKGQAILFVAPRETRMLRAIERATKQKIEPLKLPTREQVAGHRINQFKNKISQILENEKLESFQKILESYQQECNVEFFDIASALAFMVQSERPFVDLKPKRTLLENNKKAKTKIKNDQDSSQPRRKSQLREEHSTHAEEGMVTYRIDVGRAHGVSPGNIVGAIANEAGLDSEHIGRIKLYDDYSTVDLPEGMPADIFQQLKKTRVCDRRIDLSLMTGSSDYANKNDSNRKKKHSTKVKRVRVASGVKTDKKIKKKSNSSKENKK